jgi:predicted ATPase
MMGEAYEDCGYEVVEIPRASPAERADFIVNALAAHL